MFAIASPSLPSDLSFLPSSAFLLLHPIFSITKGSTPTLTPQLYPRNKPLEGSSPTFLVLSPPHLTTLPIMLTLQQVAVGAACVAVLQSSVSASSIARQKRATVCNGDSSLCSRLYSNVTFIGTHDSYAISASSIAANQVQTISTQLADGVRMLQAQAHPAPQGNSTSASGINLCHTECSLFNGGSLETWLGEVKQWTDQNPNDVVTLLIVNTEGIPVSSFASAFASTGLDQKSWSPQTGSASGGAVGRTQWPTLGAMIDAGKTVVTFLAAGADTSSVPYLLPQFSSVWENPYNQLTVPFNCSLDRVGAGMSGSNLMYLVNHYKDLQAFGSSTLVYPDKTNITTTNSEASIVDNAYACAGATQDAGGMAPNFVLLDYYDTPAQQPFKAAARLNNIAYKASTSSSARSSSGGSSGSSSSAPGAAQALAKGTAILAGVAVAAAALL